MEKSYTEINNILDLTNKHELKSRVFKGSDRYLSNEFEPVESPAADFICRTADEYSPENPLYIVAIGAITNVASAILKNPNIIENAVVVWLGGHAPGFKNPASEFNMVQDIAAARVVFGCGVPLVQLPCLGVVDKLATTEFELAHWIKGKNKLCDYLFKRTMEYFGGNSPVSKVIWDVSAIAWLMNDRSKFMLDRYVPSPVPEYDKCYAVDQNRHLIKQVYQIDRDAIFKDLFDKLVRYE